MMPKYYSVLITISFLISAITCIFFLAGISSIERRSGNKNRWWKFFIIIGSFGIGSSVFLFGHILNQIYIKNTNLVINFLLFPLSFLSVLFFLTLFFTMHIKGRDINCITTYTVDEIKDICLKQFFPAITKSLKIIGGDLNPNFYGDDEIIESLRELKRRNVEIKIIFSIPPKSKEKNQDKDKAEKAREIVINLLENKLKNLYDNLFCISPRYNSNHFMIGDKWHIRIEEKHDPWWQRDLPNIGIKAWLYFWSPVFAWRLGCVFKHQFKNSINIQRLREYAS